MQSTHQESEAASVGAVGGASQAAGTGLHLQRESEAMGGPHRSRLSSTLSPCAPVGPGRRSHSGERRRLRREPVARPHAPLRETPTEVGYSVPGSPDAASPAGVEERVAVTGRNRGIALPGHARVPQVDFDADMRPARCVVPDTHESHEFDPAEIAGGTTTSVSTMSAPAARALPIATAGSATMSPTFPRTSGRPSRPASPLFWEPDAWRATSKHLGQPRRDATRASSIG